MKNRCLSLFILLIYIAFISQEALAEVCFSDKFRPVFEEKLTPEEFKRAQKFLEESEIETTDKNFIRGIVIREDLNGANDNPITLLGSDGKFYLLRDGQGIWNSDLHALFDLGDYIIVRSSKALVLRITSDNFEIKEKFAIQHNYAALLGQHGKEIPCPQ